MLNINDYGYKYIGIETTNRCNMGCTFCGLPVRNTPLKDQKEKDINTILEELSGYQGIEHVNLHYYGEPLMDRQIWKYIDTCRELGLKTHLTTNGLLLNDKNIDLILKHSPDTLHISVQVLTPEHHKEVRGVKVSFEVYIKRVARCLAAMIDKEHQIKDIRMDLAVNDDRYFGFQGKKRKFAEIFGMMENGDPTIYNETPHSLEPRLQKFLELLEEESSSFKFDAINLKKHTDHYYTKESQINLLDRAYTIPPNITINYKQFYNGRKMESYYPVKNSKCGTEYIGIMVDGSVTCCCIDYKGKTGIGNIFEENLETILAKNSHIINGFRKTGDLYFDVCRTCMGSPTKHGAVIKNVTRSLHRVFEQ